MTTIKLRKPIQGAEGEVSEITLREPLGGDICDIGNPFTHKGIDDARIISYISRLGNIPPSEAKRLHAPDYITLANAVADFFIDAGTE